MSFNHYLEINYNQTINFGFDKLNTNPTIGFVHGIPILETLVFKESTLYFIEASKKFIYPISGLDETMYTSPPFLLESNVLEACKNGLCKVGIMYDTEGTTYQDRYFVWLEEFAEANGLDESNFFFAHGNRQLIQTYRDFLIKKRQLDPTSEVKPKVEILKYSYFENFPWFIPGDYKLRESKTKEQLLDHFNTVLTNNKEIYKEKHFLCLNRLPRLGRVLIFGAIETNPYLRDKTILTMGPHGLPDGTEFKPLKAIESKYIPSWIYEYVDSYNFKNPVHVLDNPNNDNKAQEVNIDFHQSTFLNIVTETLYNKEIMFLSEKIFKPMYMLQPFVVIGNPNTLKELKQLGYKTFSKWWDESYDEEEDLVQRILKIEKVLNKLSKLSFKELHKITQEMEETLIHNYNRFLFEPKQETLDYLNFLTFQQYTNSLPPYSY